MSIEQPLHHDIQHPKSSEQLPEWVDKVRSTLENLQADKKRFRKIRSDMRQDLWMWEESKNNGKITDLEYWDYVRDWLHNTGTIDSWWGIEN